MSWIFILLINIIAISIATLFQRLAMKNEENDPIVFSTIFQLILGLIVLSFAIIQGFVWPPLVQLWPFFLLSTVFYAVGSILSFKTIQLIEASEMIILAGFSAVVAMLGAYLFLGERLVVRQYLGTVLVLLSIILAQYRGEKITFSKGTWLGLATNALFALATVNDTFIVRSYDAVSYAGVMSVLPGLLLALSLSYFKRLSSLVKSIKNINKNLLLYSAIYSIGVITFYVALGQGALLSQVAVIVKSNIILTVVLAAIFLKETDNLWRKIVAALLCMAGVMLVA